VTWRRASGVSWSAAIVAGTLVIGCADAPEGQPITTVAASEPTPGGQTAQQSRVAFDAARAWTDLERQVQFGPRPAGSPALAETRRYFIEQLRAAGITVREQSFVGKTPAGPVAMVNVIATIAGRRTDRVVLASHYDTKRAPFRFVGANDGASSSAVLLELGRALAASQPEFTVELLFLDGEEAVNWDWAGADNTYGSRHYVATAQADGSLKTLRALVLLDMIGDSDLLIRRESMSTPWLVDIIWSAASRLGHRSVFSPELTTVEDDHVPFLRAGVAAADVIDLDNPTWHTAEDDIAHVSRQSLQVVGDVILVALPDIQTRLAAQ